MQLASNIIATIHHVIHDHFILTEVETANGYTLLRDRIHVGITASDDAALAMMIFTIRKQKKQSEQE